MWKIKRALIDKLDIDRASEEATQRRVKFTTHSHTVDMT